MDIYKNIRRISEQKKVQQKAIAEALNVRTNTVNNWFQGKTSMKAEQIPMIARLLRVQISELFDEDDDHDKHDVANEPSATYNVCKGCIEKQREIDRLRLRVDDISDRYIELLESKNAQSRDCV